MNNKLFFLATALLGSALACSASADPRLIGWVTNYSGVYARIYKTDSDRVNGVASTTWTTQTSPTYAGIHEISYSANWVYLKTTGLGSYVMGPFYTTAAHTTPSTLLPKNQGIIYRIPRNATTNATRTLTQGGPIGIFVDGVAMFDSRDALSVATYTSPTVITESMSGQGIWSRDAYVNESQTFDPALAHQPGSGQYHYHANPIGLRYLLNDHIDFNSAAKTYSESTDAPTNHSPIIGWVRDGYPIYGPYGYSNATNPASGVRRMVSGFIPRDTNTVGLTRTTLPLWAQRAQGRTTLSTSQYGPSVSATYPLGRYLEDNDYLGDRAGYTNGIQFDLDEYNGRWCVTPEFPSGTYAYFTCINTNGAVMFPYNIGRQFYGVVSAGGANASGVVSSITEPVTTTFVGGPNAALSLSSPTINNGTVTLVWSATEGGTYRVETSADTATWTTNASGIAAVKNRGTNISSTGTSPAQFFRAIRTGLASYDSTGF
jgi:hypothetical protein